MSFAINEFCRASAIEIKMFAPSNLMAANQGKQKASSKDGYLEIEMPVAYGDLNHRWMSSWRG